MPLNKAVHFRDDVATGMHVRIQIRYVRMCRIWENYEKMQIQHTHYLHTFFGDIVCYF